jgi:lysozyme
MPLLNVVIDVSHHNSVVSFHAVKASGIVGVIHKATQGTGYEDPEYGQRRVRALSVDLFWGAYHFGTRGDVAGQVEHFLNVVNPGPTDLLVLDWEPHPQDRTMTLAEAEDFVQRLRNAVGRFPVLYSGQGFLREKLGNRTPNQTVLSGCPLWIARYSSEAPKVPPAFPTFTMWQYTDGGLGPQPHQVPGIGRCDRDKFNGDEAGLRRLWGRADG